MVSESRVSLCHLGLSVLDLGPMYATDTLDDRQTRVDRLMAYRGGT